MDQLDYLAASLQDGVGGGARRSSQVERHANRVARRHQQGISAAAHQPVAHGGTRSHMEFS